MIFVRYFLNFWHSIAFITLQNGMTSIMIAVTHGRTDIVKLLTEAEADIDAKDKVRRHIFFLSSCFANVLTLGYKCFYRLCFFSSVELPDCAHVCFKRQGESRAFDVLIRFRISFLIDVHFFKYKFCHAHVCRFCQVSDHPQRPSSAKRPWNWRKKKATAKWWFSSRNELHVILCFASGSTGLCLWKSARMTFEWLVDPKF
jgi:hypothetical protein